MAKDINKKRKQDLGIFYTPQEVVDFIFDILNIWKNKEDKEKKRWILNKPPHHPSVIDPACGEGIFLKKAIDSKFTYPDWIFGIDLDEKVTQKWEEISLLKTFRNDKEKMWSHLFHQNGLERIKWDQHKSKYYGKLKKEDIKNEQFDCVVGNPPYGGLGIYEEMKQLLQAVYQTRKVTSVENQVLNNLFGEEEVKQIKVTKNVESKINISKERLEELKEISKSLLQYEVWKDEKLNVRRTDYSAMINGLNFNLKHLMDVKEIDRLKSFPIEILFVDRFIQLAKPGGWVAIIIPDGILANSNSHYVRQFISNKAKIEAIVSLPRETFRNVGTNAKTSILFLKKYSLEKEEKEEYPVFLASVEKIGKDQFNAIVNIYEKIYNSKYNYMDKSNLIQTTEDQNNREVVMVRADISLKQMMGNENVTGRWDPYYYHPKFNKYLHIFESNNLVIKVLGDLKDFFITTGSGSKRIYTPNGGVKYLQNINIRNTGIDFVIRPIEIKKDSEIDRKATRVKSSDVIFNRSGVGTLGRAIFLPQINEAINISNDVYLIRNSEINQAYLAVYLMSKFGQAFIDRESHGVSGLTKINTDDIKKIPIPVIKSSIQDNIEILYRNMVGYHQEAMEEKRVGGKKIKEKLNIAEKMLNDLVIKTEELIEGKREDVN